MIRDGGGGKLSYRSLSLSFPVGRFAPPCMIGFIDGANLIALAAEGQFS
jgi:hypothetical protein